MKKLISDVNRVRLTAWRYWRMNPTRSWWLYHTWDEIAAAWLRRCHHRNERVVFNGGNPWVICARCGTKIKDVD